MKKVRMGDLDSNIQLVSIQDCLVFIYVRYSSCMEFHNGNRIVQDSMI